MYHVTLPIEKTTDIFSRYPNQGLPAAMHQLVAVNSDANTCAKLCVDGEVASYLAVCLHDCCVYVYAWVSLPVCVYFSLPG